MKYQIYLNKETSILINELAEQRQMKQSTLIKELLESFCKIASASELLTPEKIKELKNE